MERLSREAAKGPVDVPFLLLVLLLMGIGLVMLLSASFPSAYYEEGNPTKYFMRQSVFAAMGVAGMIIVSRINYQRFRGVAKLALFGAVLLLILVIIPGVGVTHNNATRWLRIGPLEFQPSELAKLGVVLYFSDSISKKKDKMQTLRYGIAPYAVILLAIAALMMLEPHLSGTVLILGTGAALMLVGGIEWKWVGGVLAAAAAGAYLLIGVVGYGASRIAMWKDPWIDSLGDGYQMVQSYLAIGSGGLFGVGLGKSRQKYLYLPEEHNDFIFSVVCEELGLIGATIIMVLFALLILRGYWIALQARDRFGSLLVVGVTTLLAMQTFLNIAVVSGLVPATGISLPFFSYGGTALLIQLVEMGIVLSVSRQMKPSRAG
ncbi:putative lipid II flippase FtsW [Oscillibacter sp. MSJ-2]|uniref:Probable peptidoglycan glycosyltransferase FtsW n=2 Tax=Dysosmobacter acutus TaxID=2841504 RepID=A0ABS6F7S0_9FIRM|nr:putative lipid II flippase FtsW [Dysosmobacter acutus]MBU5626333.1 putative lipid II flippase FtsW [Dysosmobacter acutus]